MTSPSDEGWTCPRNEEHPITKHPTLGWPRCAECGLSPAYYDRPRYLPAGFRLNVYVPKPGPGNHLAGALAPRSAIVGEEGKNVVYYEGWVHGPAQYQDRDARGLWEAGVEHAAGRLIAAYPTASMAGADPCELVFVGTYDPRTQALDITNESALEGWLT